MRGVSWREYLDWAVVNTPFYLHFVMICFWTSFFFFFAAPARRALLANLRVVLPGSSRAINYLRAARVLYQFAWTITDAAIYKLTDAPFEYEITGTEFLEALANGGGAIVLTAHMGNYDLGAALFAKKFRREIHMVRAPEPHPETERHLKASVERAGAGAVKVDYSSAGALLSFDLLNALRRGEIVSIQGDRVIGQVAETTGEIFGRQIRLPSGPFILAQIAEVPLVPLFVARVGYRRYGIIACQPIHVSRSAKDRESDISAVIAEWCRALEPVIAARWDQWFAFAPMFAR